MRLKPPSRPSRSTSPSPSSPPSSSNASSAAFPTKRKEDPINFTISNRRLYSLTFLSFVGLLSFRGSARFWGSRLQASESTQYKEDPIPAVRLSGLEERPHRAPGELRVDWSNLPVQSQLAKEIQGYQTNCQRPLKYFHHRNNAGLGSDLHVYGMALCAAHRYKVRMFSVKPWMYWDNAACSAALANGTIPNSVSSMSCYFPALELQCPNDQIQAQQIWNQSQHAHNLNPHFWKHRINWNSHEDQACHSILHRPGYSSLFKIYDVRAAITEFQFSQVSPVVIKEAQRQHALVFGKQGVPPSHQLITVHVRWGDKGSEMALQPIPTYITAVEEIAAKRNLQPHQVHIFLATEDPRAVTQFKQAMHPSWTVYVDQFFTEMLPHRNNQTQEVAGAAKAGFGRTGLLAIGSLLVSMESDSYVLSTGSNWSRLMNELRKAILRPRKCPTPQGMAPEIWYNNTLIEDCSLLVDVQPSFSQYETGEGGNRHSNQHQAILAKLKILQEMRRQGRGAPSTHKVIMTTGPRTKPVDTKTLSKPDSIAKKQAHMKKVRYPRLQKRGQYRRRRRRRLMKYIRA